MEEPDLVDAFLSSCSNAVNGSSTEEIDFRANIDHYKNVLLRAGGKLDELYNEALEVYTNVNIEQNGGFDLHYAQERRRMSSITVPRDIREVGDDLGQRKNLITSYAPRVSAPLLSDVLYAFYGQKRPSIIEALRDSFFSNASVRLTSQSPWRCIYSHDVDAQENNARIANAVKPLVANFVARASAELVSPYPDDVGLENKQDLEALVSSRTKQLLLLLDFARMGFAGKDGNSSMMLYLSDARLQERRGWASTFFDERRFGKDYSAFNLVSEREDRESVKAIHVRARDWAAGKSDGGRGNWQVDPSVPDQYSFMFHADDSQKDEIDKVYERTVSYTLGHAVMTALHNSSKLRWFYNRVGLRRLKTGMYSCFQTLAIPMSSHMKAQTGEYVYAVRLQNELMRAFLDGVRKSAFATVRRQLRLAEEIPRYALETQLSESSDRIVRKSLGVSYFSQFADEAVVTGKYEFLYYGPNTESSTFRDAPKAKKDQDTIILRVAAAVEKFVGERLVSMANGVPNINVIAYVEDHRSENPGTTARLFCAVFVSASPGGNAPTTSTAAFLEEVLLKLDSASLDYFSYLTKKHSLVPDLKSSSYAGKDLSKVAVPWRFEWWVQEHHDDITDGLESVVPFRMSYEQLKFYTDVSTGRLMDTSTNGHDEYFNVHVQKALPLLQELKTTSELFSDTYSSLFGDPSIAVNMDMLRHEANKTILDVSGGIWNSMYDPTPATDLSVMEQAEQSFKERLRRRADTLLKLLVERRHAGFVSRHLRSANSRADSVVSELYRQGVVSQRTELPTVYTEDDGPFPSMRTVASNPPAERLVSEYMNATVSTLGDIQNEQKLDAFDSAIDYLPDGLLYIFDSLELAGNMLTACVKFANGLAASVKSLRKELKQGGKRLTIAIHQEKTPFVVNTINSYVREVRTRFVRRLSRFTVATRTRVGWVNAGFFSQQQFVEECIAALDAAFQFANEWNVGKLGVLVALADFVHRATGPPDTASPEKDMISESVGWIRNMNETMKAFDEERMQTIKAQLNDQTGNLFDWLKFTEHGFFRAASTLHTSAMAAMACSFAPKNPMLATVSGASLGTASAKNDRMRAFDTLGSYDPASGYALQWTADHKDKYATDKEVSEPLRVAAPEEKSGRQEDDEMGFRDDDDEQERDADS